MRTGARNGNTKGHLQEWPFFERNCAPLISVVTLCKPETGH